MALKHNPESEHPVERNKVKQVKQTILMLYAIGNSWPCRTFVHKDLVWQFTM